MSSITAENIKKLDIACKELSNEDKIRHVGVINNLGKLIAGGFKAGTSPLIDTDKIAMTYMQMQLDFKMRQELDEVLGPIDYIASRRTKQLIISVPIGDNLVLISAEPDADDKKIIKKAEELFDDISISEVNLKNKKLFCKY
ncbi:DUF6659 family protein [Candidatus Nitrosopumilus sediminis]|nr:DUF6659 family protein [Candidatus Nitrosopumilus sediminis]